MISNKTFIFYPYRFSLNSRNGMNSCNYLEDVLNRIYSDFSSKEDKSNPSNLLTQATNKLSDIVNYLGTKKLEETFTGDMNLDDKVFVSVEYSRAKFPQADFLRIDIQGLESEIRKKAEQYNLDFKEN